MVCDHIDNCGDLSDEGPSCGKLGHRGFSLPLDRLVCLMFKQCNFSVFDDRAVDFSICSLCYFLLMKLPVYSYLEFCSQ